MSGRRLLDALIILNASRGVAGRHVSHQRRKLDLYLRTSSLTREAKLQLDDISLGLRAASELARKFDDSPQQQPAETVSTERSGGRGTEHEQSDVDVSTEKRAKDFARKIDIDQGVESTSGEQLSREQLNPQNTTKKSSGHISSAVPEEPQQSIELKRSPTLAESTEDTVLRDSTTATSSNEPSEAIMQQLFRSPRVANKLTNGSRYGVKQRNIEPTKIDRSSVINSSPLSDRLNTPTIETAVSSKSSELSTSPDAEKEDMRALGAELAHDTATSQASQDVLGQSPTPAYQMVESRVPSTRLGRLWEYGGLATSMVFGIAGQSIRRATVGVDSSSDSLIFSPENVERLVAKLSKMRGAALKLGQLLSFQDAKMLPPAIHQVLQRVQDKANYMPAKQRDRVLVNNLGENWRNLFESFDELPMAAASIGQVHRAVLKETGKPVAVKIQYPGVANSIDSDLSNLSILLTASRLLPKGLFLDKTIANARTELAWECDYIREAECGQRFLSLLQDDTGTFMVPAIIHSASGKQVLTMEYLEGIPVTRVQNFTQAQRDWIGTQILRLSLREICEFRFMQTDPNWTNFLYNSSTNKLELLDFGASRDYPASFISSYLRILQAASRNDRETCRDLSIKLGYLTGFESPAMVNAHITSILTLSEPFMASSPDVYDFSDQTITDRVRDMIPLMLRERLAPPPEETYSLHRKLSGAFLLCARLGSRVRCKELFENALEKVEWVDEDEMSVGEGEELVDGLRKVTMAG
ncbi:Atypical/ABC1/ABC1-A protein kinase [Blastomyces dermatitidis ER-3]|uniref:Atypical/ABC1/ABC1-A protein kinase n=1 Tax=Ajellomyces dermatitidis (strain ER-3 / ATCC MYA-2586) TaxID=559297 RepID=A0ABP2F0G3_AJEDR|nr:Atypical/ABC1/ABC1-A protein kinase [Blastomyces dermatitidis ER-3]EEQ90147.1 Atypical/ABC1/ABC1-A protein kinase [Blastomyces dermatitidis ER-3]